LSIGRAAIAPMPSSIEQGVNIFPQAADRTLHRFRDYLGHIAHLLI
jgi:hypothetical protein